MIFRSIRFGVLAALLAAGFVVSAAPLSFAQSDAWDGRGVDLNQEEDAPKPSRQRVRRAAPPVDEFAGLKPFSKEWWNKQQQRDDAAGARLSRQMSICRGC